MSRVVLLLAPLLMAVSCNAEKPTRPNRPPVIDSISLDPTTLGPGDSTLFVCNATDPDGDRLYFDYLTDARLRIKGAPGAVYLFDSKSDSQVFYYGSPQSPVDTAWIQCTVRDRKSGSDGVYVRILMHP